MFWTEERTELLKKLWVESLSAREIAARLGDISRNAVIGKAHRLGLGRKIRVAPMQSTQPNHTVSRDVSTDQSQKSAPEQQPPEAPVVTTDKNSTPKETEPIPAPKVPPRPPKRVKLQELNERSCKWPIGDPLDDTFCFCGNDRDKARSYCLYHAKLAYQPVTAPRKQRRKLA